MPDVFEQMRLRFGFEDDGNTVSQVEQILAAWKGLAVGAGDVEKAYSEMAKQLPILMREAVRRMSEELSTSDIGSRGAKALQANYQKVFATILQEAQFNAQAIDNLFAGKNSSLLGVNSGGRLFDTNTGRLVSSANAANYPPGPEQQAVANQIKELAGIYSQYNAELRSQLSTVKSEGFGLGTNSPELRARQKEYQKEFAATLTQSQEVLNAEKLANEANLEAINVEREAAAFRLKAAVERNQLLAEQAALEREQFLAYKSQERERLTAGNRWRQTPLQDAIMSSTNGRIPDGEAQAMRQFYLDQENQNRTGRINQMAGRLVMQPGDPRLQEMLGSPGMGKDWKASESELRAYNSALEQHNNILGRTAVALGVFYGIQRGVTSTIQLYQQLEVQSARTAAAMGLPGQGLAPNQRLTQADLARISFATGQPLGGIYNGFETAIQSGNLSTRNALQLTQLGAQLGATTGDSPETIVNILAAGRNAFKFNGEELKQFADILKRTRDEGVISLDELQTGLGKVFQNARLAGFEGSKGLREIMAMVTGVTKEAGTAANNMTILARVFTDISSPKTIEKLGKVGISYDRNDPFATIQQITARGPEFIQGSGIFGREQSRRGLSILANEMQEIQNRIGDTAGDTDYLGKSFRIMMETATADTQKLENHFVALKALVGRDLVSSLDSVVAPLVRLGNVTDELSAKAPDLVKVGGAIRGVAEAILLIGAVGAGASVGKTLMGVGGQGFMGGGPLLNIGANIEGLIYSAGGMATQSKILLNRQILYNSGIAQGEGALGAARIAGGLGLAPWLGGGLAVGALALAGQSFYNSYLDAQSASVAERQRNAEDLYTRFTDVNEQGSSIRTGLAENPGSTAASQNALRQLQQLIQQYPDLQNKYKIQIDVSQNLISVNGKVAKSFEDISTSLNSITKSMSIGELNNWVKEARPALEQAYDIKIKQQKAKIYEPGNWLNMIESVFIKDSSIADELTGKAELDRLYKEKQDAIIAFNQQANQDTAKINRDKILQNTKEVADLSDDEKKEYEKLVANAATSVVETKARAEVESKVGDLTKEQAQLKEQQATQETLYKSYLDILAFDSKTSADIMGMVAKDSQQLYQSILDAVKAMSDMAYAAHRVAEVMKSFDKQSANIANQMSDYSRNEGFSNKWDSDYLGAMSGFAGVMTSGLAPKARPLVDEFINSQFQNIQFGKAIQNLSPIIGKETLRKQNVQLQLEQVSVQRRALELKKNQQGGTLSEDDQNQLDSMVQQEQQLQRDHDMPSSAYSAGLGSVAQMALNLLEEPAKLAAIKNGITFNYDDPQDRKAREQLISFANTDLAKSEWGRDAFEPIRQLIQYGVQGIQKANPGLSHDEALKMLRGTDGNWGAILDLDNLQRTTGMDLASMIKDPKHGEAVFAGLNSLLGMTNQQEFGTAKFQLIDKLQMMSDDMGKAAGITPQVTSDFQALHEELQKIITNVSQITSQLAGEGSQALADIEARNKSGQVNGQTDPKSLLIGPNQPESNNPNHLGLPGEAPSINTYGQGAQQEGMTQADYDDLYRRNLEQNSITSSEPAGWKTRYSDANPFAEVFNDRGTWENAIKQNTRDGSTNLNNLISDRCAAVINDMLRQSLDMPDGLNSATGMERWAKDNANRLGYRYERYESASDQRPGDFAMFKDPKTGRINHIAGVQSVDAFGNKSYVENQGYGTDRTGKSPFDYGWRLVPLENAGDKLSLAADKLSAAADHIAQAQPNTDQQLAATNPNNAGNFVRNAIFRNAGKKRGSSLLPPKPLTKTKTTSRCPGGVCPVGTGLDGQPLIPMEGRGSNPKTLKLSGTEPNDFADFDNWFNDYNYTDTTPNPNYQPPASRSKTGGTSNDPFTQLLMQAISGYGQVIANGGGAAGINGLERTLVGSLGGMIGNMAGGELPGALVQLGFSFIQGEMLSKFQKQQTPTLVEVVNFPDPVKMWTLPSSAYTQPIGVVNRGLVQHNNNTVNVMAGPKVADNVSRALFDQSIYDQYTRRST